MCGSKPKKQKQPKVVERDLKKEEAEAAMKAAKKANEEAAGERTRKYRSGMMRRGTRMGGGAASGVGLSPSARGGKPTLGG